MIGDRSKCQSCTNCNGLIEERTRDKMFILIVDCKAQGKVKALGPNNPPSRCRDYSAKGETWTLDMSRPMDEWEWEEED